MSRPARPLLATTLVLVATAVFFPCKALAVEFASAKTYPLGTNPAAVVAADFNNDGKPDLAVLNSGSNNVSILLGNGDGTFQVAKSFDVGNSAMSIAVADFNGDGKLDVAAFLPGDPNGPTNGEVRILLGNGDGTLQAAKLTTLTASAANMAVGDFNGDKKAGLVLGNSDAAGVSLEFLAGNGDGTFQAAEAIPSNVQSANFAAADFNKDGKLDLVISIGPQVQILVGKGDGTFSPGATASVADGFSVLGVSAADINGDGIPDLIVSSEAVLNCGGYNCSYSNHSSIFLSSATGSLGVEQIFATGGHATFEFGLRYSDQVTDMVTGDFNGDGKIDIAYRRSIRAFAQPGSSSWDILLGKGDGTFATPVVMTDEGPLAAAVDLNSDKLSDLVALDSSNGDVDVLINDGPTSGADLGIILASASPEPVGVNTNLTYSATVLNEGPQSATGITFTDALPNNVTFVSAISKQGSCTQASLVVTCDIGSLADAVNTQISIVVTPTVAGTITNTMNVMATETDLAPANNSASQTSTVAPTYTLTVAKSGNGSGTINANAFPSNPGNGTINCGTTCSAKFVSGTKVTLFDGTDIGDFFNGWRGACSGSGSCEVTMTADASVTADYLKGAILTVTLAGTGGGVVEDQNAAIFICTSTNGDCSPSLLPGSTVSIQAIPSGNSTFGSWSGACTGSDPDICMITMSADEAVTATFNPPPSFTMSASSTSLSASAGGQVTDMLSFAEHGGFSGAIQLACSVTGPAPLPACSLSPGMIPAGANSPSSTLTVTVPSGSAVSPHSNLRLRPLYVPPLLFASILLVFAGRESRTKWRVWFLNGSLAAVLALCGCGGGSGSSKAQPKSYVIIVTANSGAILNSTTVSLTVQ